MKDPRSLPRIAGAVESINRYVEHKIEPGGFVRAVLENDLKNAFGRADAHNRHNLYDIVSYCYNEIPMTCWGSPEAVKKWLEQ